MMTRKDFIILANTLKETTDIYTRIKQYEAVLPICKQNPRFDEDKFREACGLGTFSEYNELYFEQDNCACTEIGY